MCEMIGSRPRLSHRPSNVARGVAALFYEGRVGHRGGLIPIRSADPPDLLALFPHYFSEEVVP